MNSEFMIRLALCLQSSTNHILPWFNLVEDSERSRVGDDLRGEVNRKSVGGRTPRSPAPSAKRRETKGQAGRGRLGTDPEDHEDRFAER